MLFTWYFQSMNQIAIPIVLFPLIQLFIFLLFFILIKIAKFKHLQNIDKQNAYIFVFFQTGFNLLSIIKYFALLQYRPGRVSSFIFDYVTLTSILIILAIISLALRSWRPAPFIIVIIHAGAMTLYQVFFFKGPTNLLWCCILGLFSSGIIFVWRMFYLFDGVFKMEEEKRDRYLNQWNLVTKELFAYAINALIALAATLGVALTILYNGSYSSTGGWTGIEILSESIIFIIGYCWIAIGFISFIGLPYLHNKKVIMHLGTTCYQTNDYAMKFSRPLNIEEAMHGIKAQQPENS